MKIAIDATPLMKPRRTGVARYTLNLVRALSDAPEDLDFLLCYRLSRFRRRAWRVPPPGPRFRSAWVQGRLHPRFVKLTHGPAGRLMRWSGASAVSTVHDVFSLMSQDYSSAKFRSRRKAQYAEIARHADRIICVSTWTRDTFWQFHRDVSEDRFIVIPEGVEPRFAPRQPYEIGRLREKYGLPGSYVLYVGDVSVRKNVDGMLAAYGLMPEDSPPLVLAGKLAHGMADLGARIERLGLANRVLPTGYFPDDDLPVLYAGAECLLYPSFVEGFGLPVLEAMASGTPVVTSDRGALPETTGGVCVSVDPTEPESIKEGLGRILWDRSSREDLARRGIEWARLYDWSRVAERTLRAFRETVA